MMCESDNPDFIYEILYCGKHAQVAFQRMEELFMKGLLFDVALLVGTKQIDAHRIVLCATSQYFMTMFTSPVGDGAKKDVIEMSDVDPEALSTVVRSFYSGKIKLSMETAGAILATAHYLILTEIVDACCIFLTKHLNPSNSLGIQMLANKFECSSLFKATTVYIEALMLWVNHDLKCREEYMAELLALIKLPNLSAEFLIDHIKVHPLIKDNISCQYLIMEAMACQLIPSKLSESRASWTNCRKSLYQSFYIMGGRPKFNEFAHTIEKYDFHSNSWTSVSTMKENIDFGMTVLNNKIYVIGGVDDNGILNSFECYDAEVNSWTSLSPMPTARHYPGAVALNGDIYAIGGGSNGPLDTVERWSPVTGKWDSRQPMKVAKWCHGSVAVVNERLYVVGEGDENVDCYDPYNDRWTVVSADNRACYGMAVVAAKGFLYVIGGEPDLECNEKYDTVRRYDPVTDTWTDLRPLLVGCKNASVGYFQDKIFLAGGVDEKVNLLNIMQCYDIQLNEWKFMAPLSIGSAYCAGAVISH